MLKVYCSDLNNEGPVLRLGPNLRSFTDPQLLPKVYHRAAEKTSFYNTGIAGEVAPLLQIQSHGQHAARLKVLAPTVSRRRYRCVRLVFDSFQYSMKNMKLLEDAVDQRILMVNRTLRSKHALTGVKVDLSEWTRYESPAVSNIYRSNVVITMKLTLIDGTSTMRLPTSSTVSQLGLLPRRRTSMDSSRRGMTCSDLEA